MKKIKLGGKNGIGKFALVDDEDYEYLNKYIWHLTQNGYARRKQIVSVIYMHRQIMGLIHSPRNIQVDHINHNRLDNREINLRICSYPQNQWNRNLEFRRSSKYKGVIFDKSKNVRPWIARICVKNKRIHLGQFNEEVIAATIYDEAALEYFGEFALTNFPKENYI